MKLAVIHNSNDITLKMDNLAAVASTVDLVSGEIYLGFFKPLNALYIELIETNPATIPTLVLNYWNGSSFVTVPGVEDRTTGLTESGFVTWDNKDLAEELSTFDDLEAYWYKLTTSIPASVDIKGINLVLSDDKDFGFIPNISSYRPAALTSFIGFHQEARNIIVQNIRNSGKSILGFDNLVSRSVDVFDLLDIEDFRQASKYLALHLIFDHISKASDDQYATKAKNYLDRYTDSLNSRLISIDTNNDGKKDASEMSAMKTVMIKRV